jgi:proline iminopeptidase
MPRCKNNTKKECKRKRINTKKKGANLFRKPDMRYISKHSSDTAKFNTKPLKYPVTLYPPIEPYMTGFLDTGIGHKVYYEESGNHNGIPALFLHGGPGGGCSPRSRRFFNPSIYRIICIDQRGCGRSKPNASKDWQAALIDNNTTALVTDCEEIRKKLGIEQWGVVLGGSWGSTLALALVEAYPKTVRSLLLRGVFLFEKDEVDYLFSSGGTYHQYPEAWTAYMKFIEDTSTDWEYEKKNLLGAYYRRLTCGDPVIQNAAASAFVGYELSISKTFINPSTIKKELSKPSSFIPFALFEVFYTINNGFMRRGQLLDGCKNLKGHNIKVMITHGRADYVCRPSVAFKLKNTMKKLGLDVQLEFVAGAGHSDSEPGLVDAMVRATDSLALKLKK